MPLKTPVEKVYVNVALGAAGEVADRWKRGTVALFKPFVPSSPSSTSLVTAAHSPVVIVSVAVVLLAVAKETQHG